MICLSVFLFYAIGPTAIGVAFVTLYAFVAGLGSILNTDLIMIINPSIWLAPDGTPFEEPAQSADVPDSPRRGLGASRQTPAPEL